MGNFLSTKCQNIISSTAQNQQNYNSNVLQVHY